VRKSQTKDRNKRKTQINKINKYKYRKENRIILLRRQEIPASRIVESLRPTLKSEYFCCNFNHKYSEIHFNTVVAAVVVSYFFLIHRQIKITYHVIVVLFTCIQIHLSKELYFQSVSIFCVSNCLSVAEMRHFAPTV